MSCLTQYGNSKRLLDKTFRKRKSKGCFDYKTKSYRLGNIVYNRCIGNYVKELDYFFDQFLQYEKGQFPFDGKLGDQPNKIIEIFNIIKKRKIEFENKKGNK